MSILNLSSLRKLFNASEKKGSHRKSVSEKLNRKLAVDTLEDRVLLSVTPNTANEILVNTEYSANQTTYTNGNAVSVDSDGDYVVTWTRGDNIYKDDKGNVGWYNQNDELQLYTDRNFIDGFYTTDVIDPTTGQYLTKEVNLSVYVDPNADQTPEVYYVDANGEEGWYDTAGIFHEYTAEDFLYKKYTRYIYYIDDIPHMDNVVYREGDGNVPFTVLSGQYIVKGDMTLDGQREVATLVSLTRQYRMPEAAQLVDYNIYARYMTDEVQRLTLDVSDLEKGTRTTDAEMLYEAEIQVGEWYTQEITFSRAYGNFDIFMTNFAAKYTDSRGEEYNADFLFDENLTTIENAKAMQQGLEAIFGEGNVKVTPETDLTFKVEFRTDNFAGHGEDSIESFNSALELKSDGLAFGASVECTGMPNTYTFFVQYKKIYDDSGNWTGDYEKEYDDDGNWTGRYVIDAAATAVEITDAFEQQTTKYQHAADSIASPVSGVVASIYKDYKISVVPVYGLDDNNDQIGFDITFINESGKQDIPDMTVKNLYTIKESMYSDGYADDVFQNWDDLVLDGTIQNRADNGSFVTLKECSKEFRVNPNSDDEFNRKSKIFKNTDQYESSVALDDNGDFAISWTSETLDSYIKGSFTDIYARVFSAEMINVYTTENKYDPTDGKVKADEVTYASEEGYLVDKETGEYVRDTSTQVKVRSVTFNTYTGEVFIQGTSGKYLTADGRELAKKGAAYTLEDDEDFNRNDYMDSENYLLLNGSRVDGYFSVVIALEVGGKVYIQDQKTLKYLALDGTAYTKKTAADTLLDAQGYYVDGDFKANLSLQDGTVTVVDQGQYVTNPNGNGKGYLAKSGSILVNSYTANPQQSSAISMDDAGNFTVVWASTAQDLSYNNGIYMQCFDADGNKLDFRTLGLTDGLSTDGSTLRVDTEVTGVAAMPQVAVSPDGKTVAVSWNWIDANQPTLSEIRMSVYTYTTNEAGKEIFTKSVDSYQVDTVEGFNLGDGSATDDSHFLSGIPYSYDNNTSIQINKANQIGIAWTGTGTDTMGLDTVDTYFSQYKVSNGALTALRTKYRVNSANMNAASQTTWSGNHYNATVAMDADGDFLVSYDGQGKDNSESITVDATIIDLLKEKINETQNADLLQYINWYYMQREHSSTPVDTFIQNVCSLAQTGQFVDPDATYFLSYKEIWDPTLNKDGFANEGYYDQSRTYKVYALNRETGEMEIFEGYRLAEYTDTGATYVDYNYDKAVEVESPVTHQVYNGEYVQVVKDGAVVSLQRVAVVSDHGQTISYSDTDYTEEGGIEYLTKNGSKVYVTVLDGTTEVSLPRVAQKRTVTTTDKDGKVTTTVTHAFTESHLYANSVTKTDSTITTMGYTNAQGGTIKYTVMEEGVVVERVRVAVDTDSDKNYGYDYSNRVQFTDETYGTSYFGYRDADGNPVTVKVVDRHGNEVELPLVAKESDATFRPSYIYENHTTDPIGVDGEGNPIYGYTDAQGRNLTMKIMVITEDAAGKITYETIQGTRVADAELDDPNSEDYEPDNDYDFRTATPRYEGCTAEQYARLYQILHSVLDATKGEANGVYYTSYDAGPDKTIGTTAEENTQLTTDIIVNETRDGNDSKMYVILNRTDYFNTRQELSGCLTYGTRYVKDDAGNYVFDENGNLIEKETVNDASIENNSDFATYSYDEYFHKSITFKIYWSDFGGNYSTEDYGVLGYNILGNSQNPITVTVDLTNAYYNAALGRYMTTIDQAKAASLIEDAIEAQLTNLWPEPAFRGCLTVTPISIDEARTTHALVLGDDFSGDQLVFEFQFQGALHDASVIMEVSDSFSKNPNVEIDLNSVTGRYCRFVLNECSGGAVGDAALIEDVVVDLGLPNADGSRDMDAVYAEFRNKLVLALNQAGYEGLYDIAIVDMVCDQRDGIYEYGQTYKVLSVKFKGEFSGKAIGIGIDTSNPDANNNTGTGTTAATPKYPDWAANVIRGYHDKSTGTVLAATSRIFPTVMYEGTRGTAQAFSNVSMTPDWDCTFVWTQYNQDSWGTTRSESIYTRTYNEETDNYGPVVSDIYFSNSQGLQKITHGSMVEDMSDSDDTNALIVTFTEEMFDVLKRSLEENDAYTPQAEAQCITNLENWVLVKDGSDVIKIKEVYFGMNASADPYIQNKGTVTALAENKWEAVLIFDEDVELTSGNYTLQIQSSITDANGQHLNSDGTNTDGSNFVIDFDLITGAQDVVTETTEVNEEGEIVEQAGNQQFIDLEEDSSDIWSPTALASDPEGDTVTVWTSDEKGYEGIFAKIKYLKWDEYINKDNREEDAVDEGTYTICVTDDTSAKFASVDMSGDGNFVVTWTADSADGSTTAVYAQVFDLNGMALSNVIVVSQAKLQSKWSQVAVSHSGDFVVTWQSYDKETGWDIYAQRYDQYGNILGTVNEVQTLTFSRDFSGSFRIEVTDPNTYKAISTETIKFDKTYTTYLDIENALNDLGIQGVTFKAVCKSRTQIAITIICDSTVEEPDIDELVVVTVGDITGKVAVDTSVDGSRMPFMVNQTTDGNQIHAAIDMDYEGNFVISWTGASPNATSVWDTDIYARQFSSSKSLNYLNSEYTVSTEEETTTVLTTLDEANSRITWIDDQPEPLSTQSGVAHITVISDPETGMGWTGSGVLLSDGNCMYVLTAQHCVNSDGTVANTDNSTVEFYNLSGSKVTATVDEVYLYSGYNPKDQYGDIALIKLKESLSGTVTGFGINRNMGAEQGAIYTRYGFGTYGKGSEGNTEEVDGTMHTGQNRWEYTSDNGFLYFDFDDGTSACNRLPEYISYLYGDTISSDLGIGATETNSCKGDSGGPCLITVDGKSLIAGICAGGYSADSKYGDVSYDTQVAYYADWIDSITGVGSGATGGEFIVNTTKTGSQKWSDVALDADGDFVITWTSSPTSSSLDTDVYARRFNSDGTAISAADFQVNTFGSRQQQLSKVAMDADGDFVITWESYQEYGNGTMVGTANNYGIYMQRYASNSEMTDHPGLYGINGESGKEMRVNTTVAGNQRVPNVAMTATGDIFIAWQSDESVKSKFEGSEGIYSRAIYKNTDDAGPCVVSVTTEYSPLVIGTTGQLIDKDGNLITDENGNPIDAHFIGEGGKVYLQNSDYYFIDSLGNLVNPGMEIVRNGYLVDSFGNVTRKQVTVEFDYATSKLYIKWNGKYVDRDGTVLGTSKTAADTLLKQVTKSGEDSCTGYLNIEGEAILVTVMMKDGEIFILENTEKTYYTRDGKTTSSPVVVDKFINESGYLLDENGKQVVYEGHTVKVGNVWTSEGKIYIQNSDGYYINRAGETSTTKIAAATFATLGRLVLKDGTITNIPASVRCENGDVYLEYIVYESLDREGNQLDRTDFALNQSIVLSDSSNIVYGKLTDGIYITFDEQLFGQKDEIYGNGDESERNKHSILNKDNITIMLDGKDITSQLLDHIELANDLKIGYDYTDPSYIGSVENHSEKNTYKLVFKEGVSTLDTGSYQIIIKDRVEDRFGNQLDGNMDGISGGNVVINLNVVAEDGDESAINAVVEEADVTDNDTFANTNLVGDQSEPVVAMNKYGDYVVVWVSENMPVYADGEIVAEAVPGTTIYAQRYDRFGNVIDEKPINVCQVEKTTTDENGNTKTTVTNLYGEQSSPDVAMDDQGNFAVTWTVRGRDLDNNGTTGDELAEWDVYVRTYDVYGQATSAPFLVDDDSLLFQKSNSNSISAGITTIPTYTSKGTQKESSIAYSRENQTFVVTWTNIVTKNDLDVALANKENPYWAEDLSGVYMARFKVVENTNAAAEGSNSVTILRQQAPQLVNDADFMAYDQCKSAVAMDADDNVVVTWQSSSKNNTVLDVYLKKFEITDTLDSDLYYISAYSAFSGELGEQIVVNQNLYRNQMTPDIDMNDNGDFVIAWASDENTNYDIKFRTYTYDSTLKSGSWTDEQLANLATTSFNQITPSVAITRTLDVDGTNDPSKYNTSFAIAWTSYGQEKLSTYSQGVYMISYMGINVKDGVVMGDTNIRTNTGTEVLVNSCREQDETMPDIAMSQYGDIVAVWEGPIIAGIENRDSQAACIAVYKALLAQYMYGSAAYASEFDDLTAKEIEALIKVNFGDDIYRNFYSHFGSSAVESKILAEDGYTPLMVEEETDSFSVTKSVASTTSPSVVTESGKTTVYAQKNTASNVVITLANGKPAMKINDVAVSLDDSSEFDFNGSSAGNATVNVTVRGVGGEEVSIENGICVISNGSYSFTIRNMNFVTLDSQNVKLNVTAQKRDNLIVSGDMACLSESAACFTIYGCTEILAIGQSSAVAKLTGTEDDEEFQVEANQVSMTGSRLSVTTRGFGEVQLDGNGQDAVVFTENGSFNVNDATLDFTGSSKVSASNFRTVNVLNGGSAVVNTSARATVNTTTGALTLEGANFTQTFTDLSALTLNGSEEASAELNANANVTVAGSKVSAAAYSVNGFGQVVVKNAAAVSLTGTDDVDTLNVNGSGFVFETDGSTLTFDTYSSLVLNDSEGADSAVITSEADRNSITILNGVAKLNNNVEISGVATLAIVCANGNGEVTINGTAGDDSFTLSGEEVSAVINGAEYTVQGAKKAILKGMGGNDSLTAYDTTGDDAFTVAPGTLTAFGKDYSWTASNIGNIKLYQVNGGNDSLIVNDSYGKDSAVVSPKFVSMMNTSTNAIVAAYGFSNFAVNATIGVNTVSMYDSTGDDLARIDSNGTVSLSGAGYYNQVSGFTKVNLYSLNGGDDTMESEIEAVDEIFAGDSWEVKVKGFEF